MDSQQAPLHVDSILPAVADALLNLPSHSYGKDQSRSWFPCEIKVRRRGREVLVRFQPTSHGKQGYEFARPVPSSEVNWHDAFRVAPEDPHFVAILLAMYDGLLQLQSRLNSQSQHCRAQCDTDFQVTFGIWPSNDILHCDTIETDDFLSKDSMHSEVTSEQCLAFSRCVLQAFEAEASRDSEHQILPRARVEEVWPFLQCFTKYATLERSERSDGSSKDVCYEDSNATLHCCQDVEMQDIGDRTLLEIESEPFCAAVEERQTPQMPSQVLLPKQFTKLGTSGPAWDVVPYQSSSHSPDRVQQELKCLLQPQPTGDKRDAGCLSMIYVIYLPELDRFKIGSVKQRRLKGELESAASFREEGCMRRMARIKKECGYRRIELGYQSEPLETCLIRRLERFVHRALSSVADKICCLKTKPKHNHVGFFDAEFRVIRDIVEKSLALIQEGVWDGSQCSSLSKSNLKANDFLRDVKPGKGKHNVETASPESEHPINILNHFCTALRPGSTHHPIYHPAQLSSEDQHRILLILDNHRHQHKRTEVRSGNLIDEAEDGKTDEQIFGLITLVEDAPALHDWKVLSRSKGHEADDLTWEPLVNLLPGSLDEILDFIAGCLLQSRSHDKLVRYLRLHQQLSQLR